MCQLRSEEIIAVGNEASFCAEAWVCGRINHTGFKLRMIIILGGSEGNEGDSGSFNFKLHFTSLHALSLRDGLGPAIYACNYSQLRQEKRSI